MKKLPRNISIPLEIELLAIFLVSFFVKLDKFFLYDDFVNYKNRFIMWLRYRSISIYRLKVNKKIFKNQTSYCNFMKSLCSYKTQFSFIQII